VDQLVTNSAARAENASQVPPKPYAIIRTPAQERELIAQLQRAERVFRRECGRVLSVCLEAQLHSLARTVVGLATCTCRNVHLRQSKRPSSLVTCILCLVRAHIWSHDPTLVQELNGEVVGTSHHSRTQRHSHPQAEFRSERFAVSDPQRLRRLTALASSFVYGNVVQSSGGNNVGFRDCTSRHSDAWKMPCQHRFGMYTDLAAIVHPSFRD
jgi:hypothetical protein